MKQLYTQWFVFYLTIIFTIIYLVAENDMLIITCFLLKCPLTGSSELHVFMLGFHHSP